MVTVLEVEPLEDPTRSTAWTTSKPSMTLPKTTCLPSNHLDGLVAVETIETTGDLRGLDGADEELRAVGTLMRVSQESVDNRLWKRTGTGVGHGEDTGASVPQVEVLVLELLAVDALTTGALGFVSSSIRVTGLDSRRTLPRVKSPP